MMWTTSRGPTVEQPKTSGITTQLLKLSQQTVLTHSRKSKASVLRSPTKSWNTSRQVKFRNWNGCVPTCPSTWPPSRASRGWVPKPLGRYMRLWKSRRSTTSKPPPRPETSRRSRGLGRRQRLTSSKTSTSHARHTAGHNLVRLGPEARVCVRICGMTLPCVRVNWPDRCVAGAKPSVTSISWLQARIQGRSWTRLRSGPRRTP